MKYYSVERRGFRYTPDDWEVQDGNGRPIMRFSWERRDEAEHLADMLNEAYTVGYEKGVSAALAELGEVNAK